MFAFLFLTGSAWCVADWHKNVAGDDFWQTSAAWLLMLHGGGAMVILLLLGSLLPLHAQRGFDRICAGFHTACLLVPIDLN